MSNIIRKIYEFVVDVITYPLYIRFPENLATHPTVIHFYKWMYLFDPDIRGIPKHKHIVRVRSFNSYQTNSGAMLSPVWNWQRFKIFFFIRPYLAIVKPPTKKEEPAPPNTYDTYTW